MKNARVVELHSAAIIIDSGFGGGIYHGFGGEKYKVGYDLAKWLRKLLDATYIGVDFKATDIEIEREYQGMDVQVEKIEAEVLGPNLLDMKIHCKNNDDDTWVQHTTYSGSFSVMWCSEDI